MLKDGCPGSKDIKEPKPEDITCRHCGKDVEIWSDESEVKCKFCGKNNLRIIGPTCLDWCAFAKECVGEEKYKRIKAGAGSKN
jgi:DNA-directed RNA polymerase subunit RPC12/RpoP